MQSSTKLVSVVLTAAMMLVVASASAGIISSATFTTDAGTGISPTKTYTHLFDMGHPDSTVATVNGVAFNLFSNPNRAQDMTITHDNLTLTTVPNPNVTTGFNDSTVAANGTGVATTEGVFNLMFDCFTVAGNHQYSTAKLTGLTPGTEYDLRLYYCNQYPHTSYQTRSVDITFDVGGAEDFINIDEHTPDYPGPYHSSYLSYKYTAPFTGILEVKLDHITGDNLSWTWHGLSNEVVGVPEPSTLVMLACGLLGLLAYAWRKRK